LRTNDINGVFLIYDTILTIGSSETMAQANIDHYQNLKQLQERCAQKNIMLSGKQVWYR